MATAKKPRLSPTNISLAGEVARDVQLDAILLRKAQVTSDVDLEAAANHLDVSQQHRSSYTFDGERSRIAVTVALRLQLTDSESRGPVVLSVSAEYRLLYSVPAGKTYRPEALKYFGELNGLVNIWPYWRELIHTVAARVGLGSITLPVYRAVPKPVRAGKRSKQAPS